MHRVAFVIYPGFELLDMSGPAAVFDGVNYVLAQDGKSPFYSVDVFSAAGGLIRSSCGVGIHSQPREALDAGGADTLLIMGAQKEHLMRAIADAALRAWLLEIASQIPRFGSVCSGAFLLASLGLIDGRSVATHWNACTPLAKAYPQVNVDADALYVVDDNLWTSAGVTTGIDMALAMVTRDLDAATRPARSPAGSCSTHAVPDFNRSSARCCRRRPRRRAPSRSSLAGSWRISMRRSTCQRWPRARI
jgi:transcriptional regulator GlxA family with amidase domain